MVQIRIPNNHEFKWSILSLTPNVSFKRKILEAYFIKTLNPVLNNQLTSDRFISIDKI